MARSTSLQPYTQFSITVPFLAAGLSLIESGSDMVKKNQYIFLEQPFVVYVANLSAKPILFLNKYAHCVRP